MFSDVYKNFGVLCGFQKCKLTFGTKCTRKVLAEKLFSEKIPSLQQKLRFFDLDFFWKHFAK
jgi:hypothetical protein